MSLLDNFPHRCTIQRRVHTKGSLGGSKDTMVVEQTDVECWEQQASNSEVKEYQQDGMSLVSKVYFHTDPGVSSKHQVMITERNGVIVSSPVALDVVSKAAPDASAGMGVAWKVFCGQITASV